MTSAYPDSATYLRDELAKVELLVRAHYATWRAAMAAHKPRQLWGVPHVGTAEVESFLDSVFTPPEQWAPAPEAKQHLDHFFKLDAQIQKRIDATPDRGGIRLWRMARIFELDGIDTAILVACLLPQFDPRYRRLYGYLLDDASRNKPTVELLWQIVRPILPSPEEAWERFSPEAPLFRRRVMAMARNSHQPLLDREVTLDECVAGYLLGCDAIDTRLQAVVKREWDPIGWDDLPIDTELLARLQQLVSMCQRPVQTMIHFQGADGTCRRKAAMAIASQLGAPLLRVDCDSALRDPAGFREIAELVYREARLHGAILDFEQLDALFRPEIAPDAWRFLLELAGGYEGITIFTSNNGFESRGFAAEYEILRFPFRAPGVDLRALVWNQELRQRLESVPFNPEWPSRLASAFQLTQGQIRDAVHGALTLAVQRDLARPQLSLADLQEACRRQSAQRLGSLVRRIEPSGELSLHDLILPDPNKQQLIELRDCIRHQHRMAPFDLDRFSSGNGIIALFAGASGTGKTMSAELLARDRGVDLYKVDLSAVVSKWVGETPKNMNRIFEEGEGSNAILFFDEADSVFGKRSRINSPQDRWANLEVNYLLQRVESYSGVVILATNLKENIDEAFLRRIHRTVDFPFPDAASRFRIWSMTLPRGKHDLTEQQLREVAAKFELSGGGIRNAVIDSAFRALAADTPVIQVRHVIASVAREIQKLGRPVTRGDFGSEFYAWAAQDVLAPLIQEAAVGA